mmetsp:Transcript_33878/g.34352  ORF Transcript_33878/g.34352 Transcript_33878/m.34352 type:complete len:129 (+) Transcript_33878:132-518(+)
MLVKSLTRLVLNIADALIVGKMATFQQNARNLRAIKGTDVTIVILLLTSVFHEDTIFELSLSSLSLYGSPTFFAHTPKAVTIVERTATLHEIVVNQDQMSDFEELLHNKHRNVTVVTGLARYQTSIIY